MVGIYKITNPKGAIYIGQSQNINSRFSNYRNVNHDNGQQKLYNSLRKHGYENHIFEVVEECFIEQLDELEIYWIKEFNSYHHINKEFGLNLTLGGSSGRGAVRTEEMKLNHSVKTTGKVRSTESKNKVSIALKGVSKPENFGDKMGKQSSNREKSYINSVKEKDPNHYLTGNTRPDWVIKKIKNTKNSTPQIKSPETILKLRQNNVWNKAVEQYTQDDVYMTEYISMQEAGRQLNINSTGIYACCKGKQKTAAGFKWKYK